MRVNSSLSGLRRTFTESSNGNEKEQLKTYLLTFFEIQALFENTVGLQY